MKHWPIWVAVILSLYTLFELHSMNASVGVLVQSSLTDNQSAVSRWREQDGISLSISTYRDPFETDEQFTARHQRAVLEMMKRLKERPWSERIEHR